MKRVVIVGGGYAGVALARALDAAAGARRVIAIERDQRCLAALAELAAAHPERLEIVAADALELDPATLAEPPRKIVANLPYNIATPLLVGWIERIREYESLTLMFQREVAERLVARPRSKSYGRLSVLLQWVAEARILFDVPAQAFVPPPKVTSSLVAIRPRPEALAPADRQALERITAAAFGQRRKMLRASLKPLGLPIDRLLERAGILPTARAEELSVAEFCALARAFDGDRSLPG